MPGGSLKMPEAIQVRELVYEATLQFTEVVDFGIDLQSALSGAKPIPPEGARINVSFEGDLKGPKLKGKVAGTDYILFRGDAVGKLNIHAIISTDDGERIALWADGVFSPEKDSPIGQVRENVSLHTAVPKYAWVNRLQLWATGQADLSASTVALKVYSA